MKHIFLISIFILYLFSCKGQSRIGFSEADIRNEFSENTFKSGTDKDGDRYIIMENDISTVCYYFSASHDWKCHLTVIVPDSQPALNYLVEKYNKEYVVISETKWKRYGSEGILTIILTFADDGGYYFSIFQ